MSKRTFGSVRKLPSGRYQARYMNEGQDYSAPQTFDSKADADAFLSEKQTEIRKQEWIDPSDGETTFREFADDWLEARLDLRPNTRSLYRILLDKWLLPHVGDTPIGTMTRESWKRWYLKVSASKPGSLQPGKAYKLAHAILASAVDDRRITYNPCVVKGAGTEASPERPIATITEAEALADAIEPQYRAIVLLAFYGSLRFGELAGLQRRNVDLMHGTVRVEEQAIELENGTTTYGPPKTEAGKRTMTLPADALDVLRDHLDAHTAAGPDALVFTAPRGGPLRRTKFRTIWLRACKKAGITGLHFHDLRGSGLTLAAQQGATTAELMFRAGHKSFASALRYQHASADRDRMIAERMTEAARTAREASTEAEPLADVVSL
jgi:integrase